MNERIKELAEQCGHRSNPDIYDRNQSFDIQKFAELIIRDCVGVVENMSPGYDDYRNQIEDAFRDECVDTIFYKFGIKK